MLTTTEINSAIETFKSANVLATVLYIQAKHFGFKDSIKCHKDALNKFNNYKFILEKYDGCECVNIDEIICEIENISIKYMENCSDKLSREESLNLINLRITQELAPLTAAIGSCFDITGAGDTICDQIQANATNISTNSSNISTNTSNISTNTSNISTNTSNISTNTTNIATNVTNIATNVTNIATNVTNIATNTAAIAALQLIDHDVQDVFVGTTNATGYTTTISSSATWTDIVFSSAMTVTKATNFSLVSNNKMTFNGSTTKLFLVSYSMTLHSELNVATNRSYKVALEKYDQYGVPVAKYVFADVTVDEYAGDTGKTNVSAFQAISLAQDEYFVPVIQNVDDTTDIDCNYMNFLIWEIQ